MKNTYRSGYVYVQNRLAGILSETEDGYRFAYDDSYMAGENPLPVSITLSLSEKEFISKTLFPFFDGIIPEGWLLNIVSNKWGISQNDRFGLLLVSCVDCVGDVSIRSKAV